MQESERLQHWLALVAQARLAVGVVKGAALTGSNPATWDISQAEDYLENAFMAGLTAHGRAILKEHLAGETADVAS